MFKTLNTVMGHVKKRTLPTKESDTITANKMTEFYINKIKMIRSNSGFIQRSNNTCLTTVPTNEDFTNFAPVTMAELKKIVLTMNSKTCIEDPIPTSIIKENIEMFLPLLHHFVNLSLTNKIFPEELKLALITPNNKRYL